MAARRFFWIRSRGRSKAFDAGAATVATMWWGKTPRMLVIDEICNHEPSPENEAFFRSLWERARAHG